MVINMVAQIIFKRLPKFREILPVYAITAFMVYGWTLFTYLRYLHYWLQFLNLEEILAIFCYAMLADLVESLIILSVLLGICLLLPSRFLRDMFIVRGTLIMVCILGSMLVFLNYFTDLNAYMITALLWTAATVLVTVLVAVFTVRLNFVVKAATWLSDSMIIFLYIFMPITVLSLLVVLVRNIVLG